MHAVTSKCPTDALLTPITCTSPIWLDAESYGRRNQGRSEGCMGGGGVQHPSNFYKIALLGKVTSLFGKFGPFLF